MRRPCLRLFVASACGIVLWRIAPLPETVDTAILLGALAVAGVACAVFWRTRPAAVGAIVLLAAAGYVWASARGRPEGDDLVRMLPGDGAPLEVSGRVIEADLPPPSPDGDDPGGEDGDDEVYRFVVAVESARGDSGERAVSGRTRVTVIGSVPAVTPGDRVRMLAWVSRPRGCSIPGGFDYADYLARHGIFTTAKVSSAGAVKVRERAGAFSPRAILWRARFRLVGALRDSLPPRDAALVAAMLVGEKGEIPRKELEEYYHSGVGHIFAVSGLHVGLVAGALWLVLGAAGVDRKRAGVVVAVCVVLYAMMAGARTPAMRAAVMTVAFVGAVLFDREADPLNVLSLAALVILAWRPAELFGAGFQLSFVAVAFITLLYGRLEGWWRSQFGLPRALEARIRRGPAELASRWLRRSFWVALAAQLGLWPLVLYHFGYIVPWSVPVNTMVVPVLLLALYVGSAQMVLGLVGLGSVCAGVTGLLLAGLRGVVSLAGHLPGGPLYLPGPHMAWLCLYYVLWAATLSPARPRRTVIAGAWFVAVNAFMASILLAGGHETSRVDFIDCGSGNATVVRPAGGGTILIDCGSPHEGTRVADFLAASGTSRIDLLVLTRDDRSARDGESLTEAVAVLARFDVGRVLVPRIAAPSESLRRIESVCLSAGIPFTVPQAGDEIRVGGALVEVLSPSPPMRRFPRRGPRSPSTALRVSLPEGVRVLFASSDSADAARMVAGMGPDEAAADVLRLGCTYFSTSPLVADLVRAARPAVVVVGMTGYEEASPGGERLLKVLDGERVKVLTTGRHGTVRMSVEAGGAVVLSGYRDGRWSRLHGVVTGR